MRFTSPLFVVAYAAGPVAAFLLPRPLLTTQHNIDRSVTALNICPTLPCEPDQYLSPDDETKWHLPHWPNPADFRFNYHNLLSESAKRGTGIAKVNNGDGTKPSVAVVGAGIAGMTAARELWRCGFKVDIYEASPRIGGRLYTSSGGESSRRRADCARMELGAMRMPFFKNVTDPESPPNSILEYYLETEPSSNNRGGIVKNTFPNPGATPSSTVSGTGIFVNRGLGTDEIDDDASPKLINWDMQEGDAISYPQDPFLTDLAKEVDSVIDNFQKLFGKYYTKENDDWDRLWDKVTVFYDKMSFHDLAKLKRANQSVFDEFDLDKFDGDLGGFGMNATQTDMLYTIGVGDGSWGAFYSIAALWFLRCTMFGFGGKQLQTIEQYAEADRFPNYGRDDITDADGASLPPPYFEGIQSIIEYLYYVSPTSDATSDSALSHSMHESSDVHLRIDCPVEQLEYSDPGIKVTSKSGEERSYDYAIVTTTTHASQVSMRMLNFKECQLPQAKRTHSKTQHSISSLKLFFPLKTKYWTEEGNLIPQIIVTDTYIQDAYALEWSTKKDAVLLASYTWEADALKLASFDTKKLGEEVLKRFDEITTSTCGDQKISDHVDKDRPFSFEWIKQPTYMGCSNLYRTWSRYSNLSDLAYNQEYGKESNLYFCGENYGVEGGWTEPALRSALDCVVQINKHAGSTFTMGEMNPDHEEYVYPTWKVPSVEQ